MTSTLNGKTWLVAAGVILSGISFMSGWMSKREVASERIGSEGVRISELENWRKEHTDTATTPGMERLRHAELALVAIEGRLTALENSIHQLTEIENTVGELKRQVGEIREVLQQVRTGMMTRKPG